jgi:hypothetical protein
LECIAESKGVSVGDVEGLVTAAKGPASSGTVAEAVKFHDDKALYTVRTGPQKPFERRPVRLLSTLELIYVGNGSDILCLHKAAWRRTTAKVSVDHSTVENGYRVRKRTVSDLEGGGLPVFMYVDPTR